MHSDDNALDEPTAARQSQRKKRGRHSTYVLHCAILSISVGLLFLSESAAAAAPSPHTPNQRQKRLRAAERTPTPCDPSDCDMVPESPASEPKAARSPVAISRSKKGRRNPSITELDDVKGGSDSEHSAHSNLERRTDRDDKKAHAIASRV